MITPKCTGSTPKACATGRKIGVVMMISRRHVHEGAEHQQKQVDHQQDDDRIVRHRLHKATIVAGTWRKASSQPKAAAQPMTISTIAVVRTAAFVASTKSFQLSGR